MKTHRRNPNWVSLLLVAVITAFIDPTFAENSTATTAYVPVEMIFLNCGAPKGNQTQDGLIWEGDFGSRYALGIQKTVSATSSYLASGVPTVPYMTARIFETPFNYTFPVTPGRKFVRLHFYPSNFTDPKFVASDSFFSASVGPYTILNNFSPLLAAQAVNFDYISKEFSVNVSSSTLNLTFTPSPANNKAFAFVNGIEIVSMPQIFGGSDPFKQPPIVGTTSTLPIDENMAFETVVRLNVGGSSVSPVDDSGLYREWEDDSPYLYGMGQNGWLNMDNAMGETYQKDPNVTIKYSDTIPEYIAPPVVYSTARSMVQTASVNLNYNLTWTLTVDAGFFYLVRLHFCDMAYRQINRMGFDIFINNMTGRSFDVFAYHSTNETVIGVPVYLDFVVYLSNTTAPQQDIWVALHPGNYTIVALNDALLNAAELNGLEIFKINDSNGNLARPIFLSKQQIAEPDKKKQVQHFLAIKIGVPGVVLLILLLAFMRWKRWRQQKVILQSYGSSLPLPSNRGHLFNFSEIKTATKDFSDSLVIGVGGFGKVYRGEIVGGSTSVAIKRGSRLSNQGVHEFRTEIDMLSKLRHRHLVSLVGYCDEKDEMILVYDYMANGTLRDHLYKTQNPPLSWKQRLDICIGAARGFHYLHTGAKPSIIHRDIKTTNILLDDKWVAKVSDFGLCKAIPELDCTHVSTAVKGSFGYLDPEYFWKQKLTEKSDVYSFGVVLFEVLCGRPALDRSLPEEQVSLSNWALHCKQNGMIDQIIDPNLKNDISPGSLETFVEIAEKCLAGLGIGRPSMGDVLWNLEVALQMHGNFEIEESSFDPTSISRYEGMTNSIVVNGDSVFSDLRCPNGR